MILIEKIKPWILLQDHTKLSMIFSKKENDIYYYIDSENRATLTIQVKHNQHIKEIHVHAIVNPMKFQYSDMNYLNLDCGVGLDIDNIGDIKGYMANYLYSEYWCKPYLDKDITKIPSDTQALLWEKTDGEFGFILPVCDEKYKCTINGNENGLTLKLFSWYYGLNECKSLAFMYAEGENPFELSQKCTEFGLKSLNNGCKPRKERRYPKIFDYLGWCSWDALQIRVNTKGLLEKCEEFEQKGIPVKWLIIDDMWAEVKGLNESNYDTFDEMVDIMHDSTLYSFEADPVRFPNGLKDCIGQIKDQYDVNVGIWHPTTGYWKGIDPNSNIAKEYKDLLVTTGDGRIIHSPKLEKAFLFYNAFHTFLKKCGADFVKIDNQSFIRGYLKGMMPVGEAARNIHKAIESSVGSNFDNQLINCMGMAEENMWNRPTSAISRCSDDFMPENRAWFTKHILQCSYNSFVQGNFLWCDWDMWWSDDGQAVKNSVLRAISGGPIYLSDKLGRSIKEIIMPLIFSNGEILRCDNPALPTKDCLILDPENDKKPFKVWNKCGNSGIIATFNLNKDDVLVSGNFSPLDIEDLEGSEFVVFEHFSRKIKRIKKDEMFYFDLQNQEEIKLFLIVPMVDGFAPIGLIDKYISPKAIKSISGTNIQLVEAGRFALVTENKLQEIIINGEKYNLNNEDGLCIIDCS